MTRSIHIVSAWTVLAACFQQPDFAADTTEFFETRIRPVLVEHCYECHSAASAEAQGGLRLDSREGIRAGGDSGPSVVPGQPDESLLLDALRYESFEMPPSSPLPEAVLADFEQWIRTGADDPRDHPPSATDAAEELWKRALAERRSWWSLQPLQSLTPPGPVSSTSPSAPVDRFVRQKLHEHHLTSAAPAEAETLLRRMSFVLTGLPPDADRVAEFAAEFQQDSDTAVARLADELINSPQFGERFARHWMDVVRYTDTYGYEWDIPVKGSWEYRDYLIRAFNNDVGFDQLTREQIAGDLLSEPRRNEHQQINESLIGPLFFHMGEHRHGSSLDFNGIHQEMINNKIDAFSRTFLGLTVACARCHDHKLDAISQADYYALAGVFMSPRWTPRVLDTSQKHADRVEQLKQLREEIHTELRHQWQQEIGGLKHRLIQWATAANKSSSTSADHGVASLVQQVAHATDQTIVFVWRTSAERWKTESTAAMAANRQQFSVLTQFDQPGFPDGWVTEGDGIDHGFVRNGVPLVSLSGETAVTRLLTQGYHTHALSSRFPGAVRLPPQQNLPGSYVSLRLQGGEWSGSLVIPQNAFHSETVQFFDGSQSQPHWSSFADLPLKNGVERVRVDIMTASLNPNFPPRTGLARAGKIRLPDNDPGFNKRSWFSVTQVMVHDEPGSPRQTFAEMAPLYESGPSDGPDTVDAAWQRVADWLQAAVHRWGQQQTTASDVILMNWMLDNNLLANNRQMSSALSDLVGRYRQIESQIEFSRTAHSMDERSLGPMDYCLNPRGNVDETGPRIPRGFLEVFGGQNEVAASSRSGRLELADYLASERSPQTARVYVNRVWQWVFGQGIVNTPNDFGKLGDRPSHPELLDWLAADFMADGWSTKRLVRRLVLSRTFRQSGRVTEAAADLDPGNRLLHHYPTRRLEAEAIRDSLLKVSGQLSLELYGRPINPHRSAEDHAKRLFSGPLDGDGRRSLYQTMSIMAPPSFLVSFNLPDLKLPTGRRDVTNVPAQALVLLNHPLVRQLAGKWSDSILSDNSSTPEQRIQTMFVQALGRPPDAEEIDRWSEAVRSLSETDDVMTDQAAWSDLAHAFFNTKEFIYYR